MALVPLWLKIACTLFLLVLVPVNWRQYGLVNFLWFSDIAFFLAVAALWVESPLPASMAALAVLLPEAAWNLDFFWRLATGKPGIGLSDYMFDSKIALAVRSVSLFHVWLPILLLWMLRRLGYDPSALIGQTLLALAVVPLSYVCSGPQTNINWVYGLGARSQQRIPQPWFVAGLMAAFPALIYLPTHFLLVHLFRASPATAG